MPANSGKQLILGVEPTASTWGTAVAPTTGDLVLPSQIGPLIEQADMIPDPSSGYAWNEYIDKCRQNNNPELTIPMRWDGRLWTLIAQIMGLDTKTGSEDPYTHTITLLDAIDGSDLFSTMAAQLGPAGSELIFEWPALKPYGFTIEGPDGNGYTNVTIRCLADTVLLGSDATTDADDFDNMTHITLDSVLPGIIPAGLGRFRMNDASGDALAAGDTIKLGSFNLTFNRNISQEFVTRGTGNEFLSDEPIEDGIPEGTLNIVINDLNNLDNFDDYQAETEKKAELFFYYDANHDITISIPCMKLTQPDGSVGGASRIPQNLTYMLMKAQSNPTGMAFSNWQIVLRTETATAYE